jgi:hypothetical protein
MPRKTPWFILLAFALGCAATTVVSVPRARAEGVQRWEHWCIDVDGVPKNSDLTRPGAEGWELVSTTFRPPVVQNGNSVGGGATYLCFKRPR